MQVPASAGPLDPLARSEIFTRIMAWPTGRQLASRASRKDSNERAPCKRKNAFGEISRKTPGKRRRAELTIERRPGCGETAPPTDSQLMPD